MKVPRYLVRVDIGKTDDEKKQAVLDHNGRFVFIKDAHNSTPNHDFYFSGKITYDPADRDAFHFAPFSGSERSVCYHDLEDMFVMGH